MLLGIQTLVKKDSSLNCERVLVASIKSSMPNRLWPTLYRYRAFEAGPVDIVLHERRKSVPPGFQHFVYFERANPSHYCLWKHTWRERLMRHTTHGRQRYIRYTRVSLHILAAETATPDSTTERRNNSTSTALPKCRKPVRPRHGCFHRQLQSTKTRAEGAFGLETQLHSTAPRVVHCRY